MQNWGEQPPDVASLLSIHLMWVQQGSSLKRAAHSVTKVLNHQVNKVKFGAKVCTTKPVRSFA
jgi:hypothetical protein